MIKQLRVTLAVGLLSVGGLAPVATSTADASSSLPAGQTAKGAPRAGVVSAVNGRIAFSTGFILVDPDLSGHSQIFTINPDGTGVQKLTHVPEGSQAGDPDWSPDSARIVYVSNVSGNFEIWMMNADGSGQRRVAGTSGWDYFTPRWSPDGAQLAFSRCNVTLGFPLYCDLDVMNADGTGRHILVGSHRFNLDPDYSPDGKRIAFDSDRAGLTSAIWVVNAAGGSPRRLTDPKLEAFWPQWSPDGRDILMTSHCCLPGSQIFVMQANGSRLRQLTDLSDGRQAYFATYSPDGSQIVLASDLQRPGGFSDLYTMNADGSDLHAIDVVHPRVALSDWGSDSTTFSAPPQRGERSFRDMTMPSNLLKVTLVAAIVGSLGLTAPAFGRSGEASVGPSAVASAPAAKDGRIAFRDGVSGQIYTVNPDGSALVQVTDLRAGQFATDPVWSPDSGRLLLTIFGDGGALVYEMRADGTGARVVVEDDPGVFDVTPDYAPDGQHVVFSRCDGDRGCAIYSAGIDGTDLRALTDYRLGIHQGADFHPRVSPDGEWVSFVRQGSGGISSRLWLIRLDGTQAHPISPVKLQAGGRQQWSSNGSLIYFEAPDRGFGNHLYSMTRDGEDLIQLTFSDYPHGDFDPGNSPRGSRITFVSDRRHSDPVNVSDLFIMRGDGSNTHAVRTGLTLVLDPDWGSAPLQTGPSVRLPSSVTSPSPAQLRTAEARERLASPWLATRTHVRKQDPWLGGSQPN